MENLTLALLFLAIFYFVNPSISSARSDRVHRVSDNTNNENDDAENVSRSFKYSSILDHNDRVLLDWNVNKTNKRIRFKLTLVDVKLPFFVGFGASDHGEFENADLIVFELKSKNSSSVNYIDCYTNNAGVLKADPQRTSSYRYENAEVGFMQTSSYDLLKLSKIDF